MVIMKWGYDFSGGLYSGNDTVQSSSLNAQYNVAQYNTTDQYAGTSDVNIVSVNGLSQGQVLQFGFETEINGSKFSVQKIDLLTKNGRV